MAHGDDRDKTVIGGRLTPASDQSQNPAHPGGSYPSDDPFALPAAPGAPPPTHRPSAGGGGDRTIIGGALPGAGQPGGPSPYAPLPGRVAQSHQPGMASENTWIGGGMPSQPGPGMAPYPAPPQPAPGWGAPPPPQYPPQPQYSPQPGYGAGGLGQPAYPSQPMPGQAPHQGGLGQHNPTGFGTGLGVGMGGPGDQGFFPAMPAAHQPAPQRMIPRVSLQQALRASGLGQGSSSNPLLAAATNLLILFGRLRTGIVEMDAPPLMQHVTREIEMFEQNAMAAGASAQEANVGKYLLCGTADDIVQNLPGADRGVWIQYSMAARFFNTRDTGVGFFREAEKAIQSPAQYGNLLELMLVCLSLGFEGQYRTVEGGATQLARIRAAIYDAVRRVKPRPDEDLSTSWQAVLLGGKRRFGAIPVWAIGGISLAAVVAFFATLSTMINKEGAAAAETLYTIHPTETKIALNGVVPARPFVAQSTQLERIQAALKPEIDDKLVSVGPLGDYISIRVGNLLLFDSGKTEVKPAFTPLAERLAKVLNDEGGPVLIEGHTDSVPLRGTGKYKNNVDLSLARAESVAGVLGPLLNDAGRITARGKGEAEAIADNATNDGRAQNRRVEVMIAKEGTY